MNAAPRSVRPSTLRITACVLAIALLALGGGRLAGDDAAGVPRQAPSSAGDSGPAAQPGPASGPPAQPGPAAVPAYRQANQVAVLTIRGPIDHITRVSLERRVERALRDGATAIVLDINTPGGELTATLDICHLLKTDAPANTVAWINPQAFSAGTIIALAAREIVVQENAIFGDAAPIIVSPFGLQPLPPAERAKAESPILDEVIDSARRNQYDENLVQSFISVGVELWLIENIHTGQKIFVDREEFVRVFGEEPPRELTSVTPPDQRITSRVDAIDEGAADGLERPTISRAPLASADRENYRSVRHVISGDRLLTVRPADAKYYGLAQTIIRNDEELLAYFGAQTIVRYDQVWSESLARFLMSLPVRAILIVIFLVALFIELSAPGVGVFGATAAAALILLIGAPALVGLAQWWGVLLILLGILLIATELFILPGLGIAGVLGLLSLLVGLVGIFITGDLGTPQGRYDLWAGLATTLLSLFAAGLLMWLVSRQIHSLPVLDRLILKAEVGSTTSGPPELLLAMGPAAAGLAIGDLGAAHTDLRPNGRALFDDRLIEVQSVEGFIEKGTPLRIVSAGRFVTEVEAVRD